eukprot:TRINITY_DN9101_c0_g1_i1.p1 TRINITY_DN9101_c0_g1~~TRINITY_DN9101_c0_g1_i1.p1  ORF type:complete len:415 (+),score=111.02 TRINITY_DN9101_c0_g1_i1:106-1350(+)
MSENPVVDRSEVKKESGSTGPRHVEEKNAKKLPTVVLVIGMAGSGKTRFMHRMNIEMHEKQIPSYFVNLDPAVVDVPYGVNIDIRDTVNHQEVMKQYDLGPNGAIITSLNLFATRFDQVLAHIESRQDELEYVFIDTPGQIEVFTWSASGQIIMETLASTFPTVVTYVVDTARSMVPATFMSNMMYACGILYRTQLPLLLCLNKIDIADHKICLSWMKDADAFKESMHENSPDTEGPYSEELTKSMSGVLQEFYENLRCAGMSAVTGAGVENLMSEIKEAKEDYINYFLPELKQKMEKRRAEEAKKQAEDIQKLEKDISKADGFKIVAGKGAEWDGPYEEDTPEDDEDLENNNYFDNHIPQREGLEDDPEESGEPPQHLVEKRMKEAQEAREEEEAIAALKAIAQKKKEANNTN